jgi:hypothetical protein
VTLANGKLKNSNLWLAHGIFLILMQKMKYIFKVSRRYLSAKLLREFYDL